MCHQTENRVHIGTVNRNNLTADIFFVYVSNSSRGYGYGKGLVEAFEEEVKSRSAKVGYKVAILRIVMKSCLETSVEFWLKNGFSGGLDTLLLMKEIKCFSST